MLALPGMVVNDSLMMVVIPLGYLLLGVLPLVPALLSLLVFYGVRSYATPLLKDTINHNCPSATRATILSIISLINRLASAMLGSLIGLLSWTSSLATALDAVSGLFAFLILAAACYLKRQLPGLFVR